MGKLDILKSENRTLKMHVLTMNPSRFSVNFIKNHFISIAKHNVFRTQFPLSIFLGFVTGKHLSIKSENRVLKTLCFAIEMI